MKHVLNILVLSLVSLTLGCSNQWREGDPELSGEDMYAMLNEVPASPSAAGGRNGLAAALAYADDPNTTIFFADAPGPLGPLASVLALDHLDFLGTGQDLWYGNLAKARIFFLDSPSTTDRQNGLIIGIAQNMGDDYTYFGLSGQSEIVDGEFIAVLTGPTGAEVVLRSWDVEGDELNGIIQLRLFEVGPGGEEYYVGKFSTLIGYQ